MQKRRINTTQVIMILLVILTITAFTLTGVLGALYVKEKNEVALLQSENKKLEDQLAIPVISVSEKENSELVFEENNGIVENTETEYINQTEETNVDGIDNVSSTDVNSTEYIDSEEIDQLLMAKENEIEKSIKEKMKEMVAGEDGSPLKMLRSFFPENLIYSDNNEYVFEPVLENVKKHNLIAENFVKTENGEMQYVENGTVTSHKGIDVSKYQGNIDWNAVKADGVEYAFIRLGLRGYESGKIVTDEYFQQNIEGANSADVKAGVYFFTQAINVEEAKEEAQFVIDAIAQYDIECPIVFDVEMITTGNGRANNLSKEERTEICIAFCEEIKQAGYIPMIYGNVKCFTKMVDMSRLEDYEKWYAFYDDYMYFPYEVSCWQYTEKGKVNGIKGDVDLNISYKMW